SYTGPTPAYHAATDSYDNIIGPDSVRFPSYDNIGNLTQRIDGRGVETDYSYNDAESLLKTISYPATPALNVSLSYDSFSRLATKSDGAGSYTYNYDDLNGLTSKTTTYTGLTAKTVSYTFNNDGSRASMNAAGYNFAYTYDAAGRTLTVQPQTPSSR